MYRAPGNGCGGGVKLPRATSRLIVKPDRLAEAAVIIGEGDTPQEKGILDA